MTHPRLRRQCRGTRARSFVPTAAEALDEQTVEREEEGLEGTGHHDPDVIHGEHAACVRVERAGTGDGRRYVLRVRATDAAGNHSDRDVRVFVPHDASGHPGCVRAEGLDGFTAACRE